MPVAEPISPETAEWLDGPRLVEWLRENGLRSAKGQLGGSLERAYGRWREGGMASVYTVDQVLVKLHLHLTDIPESLWAFGRRRRDGGIDSSGRREEILRRLGAGDSVSAVARDLRIARSTVRYYRDTQADVVGEDA